MKLVKSKNVVKYVIPVIILLLIILFIYIIFKKPKEDFSIDLLTDLEEDLKKTLKDKFENTRKQMEEESNKQMQKETIPSHPFPSQPNPSQTYFDYNKSTDTLCLSEYQMRSSSLKTLYDAKNECNNNDQCGAVMEYSNNFILCKKSKKNIYRRGYNGYTVHKKMRDSPG